MADKDKTSKNTPAMKTEPKDVQVMTSILKDMGVHEHEPRVINQMLEFTYRYVTDMLEDAKVYSNHAMKKSLDLDDVKLAIQFRLDHSYTTPPPRDLLIDIASHKNNVPLPTIKPYIGPKLPPDRYCLSSANYKLKSLHKKPAKFAVPSGGTRFTLQPGLGKSPLTLVTRPLSQPTVTVQRPTMPVPSSMPVIRVASGNVNNTSISSGMVSISSLGVKRKREDDDYDAA